MARTKTNLRPPTGGATPFQLGCVLILLALSRLPAAALEGEIRIHDPSTVITCGGNYYVFGTGRGMPFLVSSNGFDWHRGGRVFDQVPESVHSLVPKNDGQTVWAPDITRLNGQYYLYYAISSWGQYVSAVGLLTSPTLDTNRPDYHWTDRGMVVHSVPGENLNAIDPGVCQAPDGTLWLCYGSYFGAIQLVRLDPRTGLRLSADSPVYIIAVDSEASDIIYHAGFYYLFVNHGSCCSGDRSTYNIRVGRSPKITGPYLDRHGEDLVRGGGTLFLAAAGRQIGPGHFGRILGEGVEKFSCHYEADLDRDGRSVLDLRPLLWSADGWPLAGENLRAGTYQIRSQWTGTVLQGPANDAAGDVQTARYLVHDDQKWSIAPAGGGCYKISVVATGRALTAGAETVRLAPETGSDDQLWQLDQLTDGSYRIASKTGKRALTTETKTKPGNGLGLQAFMGEDTQRWVIATP
jgi:arabinan endo-1,5-alpha-L-arabinosidase